MSWQERIINAHRAVTDAVSHGARLKSNRYFVWQEDGSRDLMGDNAHAERAVTGSTDLYTKQEFDPWVDALGEALTAAGIAWELFGTEFEPETGFWHHTWDWEVAV